MNWPRLPPKMIDAFDEVSRSFEWVCFWRMTRVVGEVVGIISRIWIHHQAVPFPWVIGSLSSQCDVSWNLSLCFHLYDLIIHMFNGHPQQGDG